MQNDSKQSIKVKSAPFFGADQFAKAAAFLMLQAQLRYQKAIFLPCEQRFLSCMAFSVYEVVSFACVSRSWFVYAPGERRKSFS